MTAGTVSRLNPFFIGSAVGMVAVEELLHDVMS